MRAIHDLSLTSHAAARMQQVLGEAVYLFDGQVERAKIVDRLAEAAAGLGGNALLKIGEDPDAVGCAGAGGLEQVGNHGAILGGNGRGAIGRSFGNGQHPRASCRRTGALALRARVRLRLSHGYHRAISTAMIP